MTTVSNYQDALVELETRELARAGSHLRHTAAVVCSPLVTSRLPYVDGNRLDGKKELVSLSNPFLPI
jgi:hypothetical protein